MENEKENEMKITQQQKHSLKQIFDRAPLYIWQNTLTSNPKYLSHQPISYLQFRRRVQFGYGYDCLMIQWCGMWLGIEKDGYCHS